MEKKAQNSRRKFLTMGMLAGAGALAAASIEPLASDPEKQTKKMMTASGELVEVDIRHLPVTPRKKPISNAKIMEWMEKEKNASDPSNTEK